LVAVEPSRKPFLNLRGRVFRYRMRPVPVVRLRRAFSAQLSASGKKQVEESQTGRRRDHRISPPHIEAPSPLCVVVRQRRRPGFSGRYSPVYRLVSFNVDSHGERRAALVRGCASLSTSSSQDSGGGPRGLGGQVELTSPHAGLGEAAAGALAMLLVEGDLTTPAAGAVGLLVLPLTKRRSTGTLQGQGNANTKG
jgi:hypothetical protein